MVPRRRVVVTWFTLLCLTLAEPVQAASGAQGKPGTTTLRDLSLEELGAIEVTTVSKIPMEVWSTAAAVSVLTREDIRRSGATSLPDVLRLAAGVEVARVDSSHWSIGVRGFGEPFSKSLLVLVDGRRIYTPLFAGTYWPVYDLPLEEVERIELVRGPGGTIWGGNAVNGVINVITRTAADSRGTLVAVGGGSIDHGSMTLRHGGRTGSVDYRVYARAFARGPQFHPDGVDFDDDNWMGQAGFRLDWSARERHQFTLSGAADRGQHGQRVRIASVSPPAAPIVDDPVEPTGAHLLTTWEQPVHGGSLRLQAYYDRTRWDASHFQEDRDTIDVDYMQTAPLFARHRLSWGAGLLWSPGRFTQTTEAIDFDPASQTDRRYSAYVQDEVQWLGDRLALTVGSKFEHNIYTGIELQPSVRLLWRVNPTRSVWGAVTRSVRTPSRVERDIRATSLTNLVAPLPIFLQVTGNPGFDAERHVGYEVGYRTLLRPTLYVDTAFFHNRHDGLASVGAAVPTVELLPRPHGRIRVPFVNGIDGTSSGFEITPEWRPAAALQVTGWYAFRAFDMHLLQVSADAGAVARYEGGSPRHQTRVELRTSPTDRLELDGAYRYVGRLPALLTDAYHSVDLRLGWRMSQTTTVSIAGQNLLQPHHQEYPHAPGPAVGIERSIWAGVTWAPGSR
jgi:iron complex outermembrane recepter protein